MPREGSEVLRARDVGKLLGLSPARVYALTQRGLIPHLRLGRAIVYPRRALERWLEGVAREGVVRDG